MRGLRRLGRLLLGLPRGLALVLPFLWGGLIWLGSEFSGEVDGPKLPGMHFLGNGVHAFEFGVLALLCLPQLPRRTDPDGLWVRLGAAQWAFVLLPVGAYGACDEWHQLHVPGRASSLFDVLTDLVGAICVLAVAQRAGSPDASDPSLRRLLLGCLVACAAAAGLSTWHDLGA